MTKIAIITGASSGIGFETAMLLAKNSSLYNISELWLIARREEKLNSATEIINSVCSATICRAICGDITSEDFCLQLSSMLFSCNASVTWFVNSAGCGFSGDFSSVEPSKNCTCTELNCTGAVRITGTVLPYINKGGKIVQLSSAAAFFPQPHFSVYAATKSFVFSFSRSLGKELSSRGISVTTVCPGPCDTEFLTIANDGKPMSSFKKKFTTTPSHVASCLLKAASKGRKLCLPTFSVKLLYITRKIIPDEWVIAFWGKE